MQKIKSQLNFIKKNKVQIINTFKLGFIYSLSMEHVFKLFVIFLVTMNYQDQEDFIQSLWIISISGGISVTVRVVLIFFRDVKIRRVMGMVVSLLLFSIAMFVMAGLQYKGDWKNSKYLVFLAMPAIDGFGSTIYNDFVDELFIKQIAGISHSNTRLYWLISTAVFSLLHSRFSPDTENRSSTVQWVIGGMSLGSAVLFYFFTAETHGQNIALALEESKR